MLNKTEGKRNKLGIHGGKKMMTTLVINLNKVVY